MAAAIELREVVKQFGATRALGGVSFAVAAGSTHAVVGENGAGKSTLMKILMGVHAPDAGELRLHGNPVTVPDPQAARRLGMDIVFQEIELCPNLTIQENLFLGRERHRHGRLCAAEMAAATRRVLDLIGLRLSPDTLVADLTVAQKQMVQIARSLLDEPKFLILDEPTSALTQDGVDALFAILRRLKQNGVTVLYISHKLEEIFAIADAVTVLRDGQHVRTCPITEVTPDSLVQMMVGRELDLSHRSAGTPGATRLEVRGLSGDKFKDVALTVRAGEIVGLAGLVGAGRTELVETLYGVRRATAGRILLEGRELQGKTIPQRIRSGVGLVPEDRQFSGLIFSLPLRENVSLPEVATGRLGRWRIAFFAELREARQAIAKMRIVASGPEADLLLLSGGNQQKVVISKWLELQPGLLILDDPTRGIDVGAKAEIHQFIREQAAAGRAVMVASSELCELLALCDRILVMREGRLAGELPGAQATEEAVMRLAVVGAAGRA